MTNTIERNNYVGSLLKPLLKKVTPHSGLKNVTLLVNCFNLILNFEFYGAYTYYCELGKLITNLGV
jgi:hypothetical protein